MKHYFNTLILHFLQIEHKKWKEVVGENKLPRIVRTGKVVLIIVGNLHFHVFFEALRELLNDLFNNIIHLLELTAIGAEHSLCTEVTIHVDHVGLEDFDLFTL